MSAPDNVIRARNELEDAGQEFIKAIGKFSKAFKPNFILLSGWIETIDETLDLLSEDIEHTFEVHARPPEFDIHIRNE